MPTLVKPLFDLKSRSTEQYVFKAPSSTIGSIQGSCSTASFSGTYALSQSLKIHNNTFWNYPTGGSTEKTLSEWLKLNKNIWLPRDYMFTILVHTYVLPEILPRAVVRKGRTIKSIIHTGRRNLWGMTDNGKPGATHLVNVNSFMEWIYAHQDVGESFLTKPVHGNHGGYVRGLIWTPDYKGIQSHIRKALTEMNGHVRYINKLSKLKEPTVAPVDSVGTLW